MCVCVCVCVCLCVQVSGIPSLEQVSFYLECVDSVCRFVGRFCHQRQSSSLPPPPPSSSSSSASWSGGCSSAGHGMIRSVVSMAMGALRDALSGAKVSEVFGLSVCVSVLCWYLVCGADHKFCGWGHTTPVGVCVHRAPPLSTPSQRRCLPFPRDEPFSREVGAGEGERRH